MVILRGVHAVSEEVAGGRAGSRVARRPVRSAGGGPRLSYSFRFACLFPELKFIEALINVTQIRLIKRNHLCNHYKQ